MEQQIASISIGQTAKIFAFIFAAVYIVVCAIFLILQLALGGHAMMEILPILFVYPVIGYIITIVACFVYNFAAQRVGGITISLTPIADGQGEAQ